MTTEDLADMLLRAFADCPQAGDRVITLRYNGYLHEAARKVAKERVKRERNKTTLL